VGEQQGKMTISWRPSESALAQIRSDFPHVHPLPVIPQFRDYFMDQSRNRVRTRAEWDRTFVSWCGRREEQWLTDHHEEQKPKFDEVTGMPINPKPMRFVRKDEA